MSAPKLPVEGDVMSAAARTLVAQMSQVDLEPPIGTKQRVWPKVMRAKPPLRISWQAFALGASCAAVLACALFFVRTTPEAVGVVIRANGMQRAIHSGEVIPPLAELSLVDLHTAGQLVAGRDTTAHVDRSGKAGLEIALERGSMLLHVRPRSAETPFMMRTPHLAIRVVGTILRVVASAEGDSVAVGHGTVELTDDTGHVHLLTSGQRWPTGVRNAPDKDELGRLGPTELEGTNAASFGEVAPAVATDDSAVPRLANKLATGRTGHGVKAEAALYDAGWLAWREDNDPSHALAVWQEAKTRFPSGALTRELDESIIDALVALRRSHEAQRAVESYLVTYTGSPRSNELHFVHATLLREIDGNCRHSRHELALALQGPAAPWAAPAREALEACEPSEP